MCCLVLTIVFVIKYDNIDVHASMDYEESEANVYCRYVFVYLRWCQTYNLEPKLIGAGVNQDTTGPINKKLCPG